MNKTTIFQAWEEISDRYENACFPPDPKVLSRSSKWCSSLEHTRAKYGNVGHNKRWHRHAFLLGKWKQSGLGQQQRVLQTIGFRLPVSGKHVFSTPRQDRLWHTPSFLSHGYRGLFRQRSIMQSTQFHLVPSLIFIPLYVSMVRCFSRVITLPLRRNIFNMHGQLYKSEIWTNPRETSLYIPLAI